MGLTTLLQTGDSENVIFQPSQRSRIRCLDISNHKGQRPESRDIPLDDYLDEGPWREDGKHFGDEPDETALSREDGELLRLYNWMMEGYCVEQDRDGDNMNPNRFLGALRLLYVQWPSNQDDTLRPPILPFSERAFSSLKHDLGLPRCFLADFGRRESTPTRFETVPLESLIEDDRLGIHACRSSSGNNLDFALSYDKSTRITAGFLSFSSDVDVINQLIPRILQESDLAGDPMLLPVLAHDAWSTLLARDHRTAQSIVQHQQEEELGLMNHYLSQQLQMSRPSNHVKAIEDHAKHNQMNKKIISQHAHLCNGLLEYVEDDGKAILAKLNEFGDTKANCDLQVFMDRSVKDTKGQFQIRARLLGKLDMQLQILHNLIQQRDSRISIEIAEETKRVSSAMKILALNAVIFLPIVSVASIFGMSAFSNAEIGEGKDQVKGSSQFRILWSVAGLLTVAILIAWLVWIKCKQVRHAWESGRFTIVGRVSPKHKETTKDDEEAEALIERSRDESVEEIPHSQEPLPSQQSLEPSHSDQNDCTRPTNTLLFPSLLNRYCALDDELL